MKAVLTSILMIFTLITINSQLFNSPVLDHLPNYFKAKNANPVIIYTSKPDMNARLYIPSEKLVEKINEIVSGIFNKYGANIAGYTYAKIDKQHSIKNLDSVLKEYKSGYYIRINITQIPKLELLMLHQELDLKNFKIQALIIKSKGIEYYHFGFLSSPQKIEKKLSKEVKELGPNYFIDKMEIPIYDYDIEEYKKLYNLNE